jgi:hypothetical protein
MASEKPKWLLNLTEEVRRASLCFSQDKFPNAWLYLGESEDDWYDWPETLLGLPVFHCKSFLTHSGYDGEHQKIVPLWYGDVSDKDKVVREFECRLANSGDF